MKELKQIKKEENQDTIKLTFAGGNNSTSISNWAEYLDQIKNKLEELSKEYGNKIIVESITNDVLDDIFYVNLIIYKN